MRLQPLILAVSAAVGCAEGDPVKIVAGVDGRIVLHSLRPTQLPVAVLDNEGRALKTPPLRYRLVAGDTLSLTSDGVVVCNRRTDSEITISLGTVTTRAALHCRPIRGFSLLPGATLALGGPPAVLPVAPIGLSGEIVEPFVASAAVEDTQIVVLVNGELHPRARGATSVRIATADCALSVPVQVREQVADPGELEPFQVFSADSLALRPGEHSSWPVPAGRYEFRLTNSSGQGALVLGALGTRCAAFPGGEQHYSCIVADSGRVVVRNRRSRGTARAFGRLTIQRLPAAASSVGQSADRNDTPCTFEI